MTGIELKAIIATMLIAFGITAPIPDFLAGFVIAIGLCYAAMIVSKPSDRLSLWATLFLGGLGALLAAILHQHIAWIKDFPIQAVMGVAGGMSKPLAQSMLSFGEGLKEWARDLPSKFKLPGDKK